MARYAATLAIFLVSLPAHADRTISFVKAFRHCNNAAKGHLQARVVVHNPTKDPITVKVDVKLAYNYRATANGPPLTRVDPLGVNVQAQELTIPAGGTASAAVNNDEVADYCAGEGAFYGSITVVGNAGNVLADGSIYSAETIGTAVYRERYPVTINGGLPF